MYHSISSGRPDPGTCASTRISSPNSCNCCKTAFGSSRSPSFAAALADGEPLSRSVVITFDDGYRDNLLVAKPILEEHGLPATVFVTTGYVGSNRDFWWDELESLLRGGRSRFARTLAGADGH